MDVKAHSSSLVCKNCLLYTTLSSEPRHALDRELALSSWRKRENDMIALRKTMMTPIFRRSGICNFDTPMIGRISIYTSITSPTHDCGSANATSRLSVLAILCDAQVWCLADAVKVKKHTVVAV